jgi:hypothetical protein
MKKREARLNYLLFNCVQVVERICWAARVSSQELSDGGKEEDLKICNNFLSS